MNTATFCLFQSDGPGRLAEESLDLGNGKEWTAQRAARSKQSALHEPIQSRDAHSQGNGSFFPL